MKHKKAKTSGRPKGDRPLKKISISVFEDTLPASSAEFRDALDFYRARKPNARELSEAEKQAWLIENTPQRPDLSKPIFKLEDSEL